MSLKCLPLLLLFLFNLVTTVVADSSHIDLPEVEQQCEHKCHVEKTEKDSNHKHASNHEHDCCQENHIHVYTLLPISKYTTISSVFELDFATFLQVPASTYLDIVKPPLV